MTAEGQFPANPVVKILWVYLHREACRLQFVGYMASQSPSIVRPEGKDGILLTARPAELRDGVAEPKHLGNEQWQQPDTLQQALCVVLVVEEAVPVYLGKDTGLQENAVLVCPDDVQAVRYPPQAETAIPHSVEDAREPSLIIGEVDGSTYVVIALAAPVVEFVTEYPGIRLADEHILILLEALVELLRETEVAVVCRGVEIPLVEELRVHHALLVADNLLVLIQHTAPMRHKDDVVTAQDAERLANGCTFLARRYILIYWYDYNATHLSLMIRMSPAESV